MPAAINALASGNPDSEDESQKASRLAARAARFSSKLPGNRYKELEEMRSKERKVFEAQGLIKVGKTELGDAVDMRGTCQRMCSEYEKEFREYTREVHPFEAGPNKRMDAEKAVAAYSRSDAGAGHGDSAILPSDLRTPQTLVRTLDYLFSVIMPSFPPSSSSTSAPTPRKALGYSAGFIRDRTRAIRKEFAMQSSWGHEEAIASFERIARWHILCLRELQEETGTNTDMHIDSAELGRCFTSLRQHYNDRREELGVETPCPNEAEFRAYMLIFDLTQKAVSILTAELPSSILDHPLIKLAWDLRCAAQRNFDSQKEGSKLNAELGANIISRFVKLLKGRRVPYLMSCLVEIRLREMRRSALRALVRTYPRLRAEPIRVNEQGEVVERRMVLIKTLNTILGCEEQEREDSAWDDIVPISNSPDLETVEIVKRFGLEVYEDMSGPVGVLLNLSAPFNDNRDAPYTRRWKSITEKQGNASYADIVNGKAGVNVDGTPAPAPAATAAVTGRTSTSSSFTFAPSRPVVTPTPSFSFKAASPAPTPSTPTTSSSAFLPPPAKPTTPAFSFTSNPAIPSPAPSPVPKIESLPPPKPSFFPSVNTSVAQKPTAPTAPPAAAHPSIVPSSSFSFGLPPPPTSTPETTKKKRVADDSAQAPSKAPLFSQPAMFSSAPPPPVAGPSTTPVKPVSTAPPIVSFQPAVTPQSPETSSSPRQRKKSAHALLSSSTRLSSSSISRKPLTESQVDRHKRLTAIPAVCDQLIAEVLRGMVEDHASDDINKLVKQQTAATQYTNRKRLRSQAIKAWSKATFRLMIAEQTKLVARVALIAEVKRRFLVRKVIKFWRSWAKNKRENREEAERKRATMYTTLTGMGLSRSMSIARSETSTPISDIDVSLEAVRLDSLQIDIEISNTERSKDDFFAPSTFLNAITRHITPFLSPSSSSASSVSPRWQTIISVPPTDFGTPPDLEVQEWLVSKFARPKGEDLDHEGYSIGGVLYDTKVLKSGRELPKWSHMGLLVFEAPMKTDDQRKIAENTADAQDRIGMLMKNLTDEGNRYTPSLLILTWEQESLEELGQRLQIEREIGAFDHKAIVSLQLSNDLDERFSKALDEVTPELAIKDQVVIGLEDVITTVYPAWQRFTDIADLVLSQRSKDVHAASSIFESGVGLINQIPSLVESTLGPIGLENVDPYEPIVLPTFSNAEDAKSPLDLVEKIAEYLEHESLAGIDDLDLLIAPLHQAAISGQALPIIPLLQSLSFLVLGEMRDHQLRLKIWYPSQIGVEKFVRGYMGSLSREYEKLVEEKVKEITSVSAPTSATATAIEQGGIQVDKAEDEFTTMQPQTQKKGKKRTRTEIDTSPSSPDKEAPSNSNSNNTSISTPSAGKRTESKSAKNARLLKALNRVQRTLEEMEMEVEMGDVGASAGTGMKGGVERMVY
ncbi:hypothetical protein CI109_103393 [Kwoniella shandongensis]|uniref:Uncharacterized protein n=1 Tax=Kwoniella shandongensis TaxID=1734106 RepID=A0A5M6BZB4_9TREE|nr:uncharacterized protein CI109_004474 [Kwoniella shandongensis]KAA5527182.1 hypothetical protein CI109_004474 [Kwoniella shandongensis]